MDEFGKSQKALLQAYESWRDLTMREREALQRQDWFCVASCQAAKSDLQSRILPLTEASQRESALGNGNFSRFHQELRKQIEELITCEENNSELVEKHRRKAEIRQQEIECTHALLGQVHKTYRQTSETWWTSYS